MKSFLFTSGILKAKLRILEQQGEAVTRRLDGLNEVNKSPNDYFWSGAYFYHEDGNELAAKPRYQVGDICYIKEACRLWEGKVEYKADQQYYTLEFETLNPWRSPLFIPAWAARHFVKVTDVGIGRVQGITDEDAIKEGVVVEGRPELNELSRGKFRQAFAAMWDSAYPKYPWEMNPYVWRIAISKVERPVGVMK